MTLSFGTDGVRGAAPEALNPRFVNCLAVAASEVLSVDRWVIGRDTRESGPALSEAVIAALESMQRVAIDAGVAPTPTIAHLAKVEDCAGVVVSASHNPWTDNGIKIFAPGGRKLHDHEQTMIETRLHELLGDQSVTSLPVSSALRHPNPMGSWIESINAALENRTLNGMRLVVDCANGAASEIADTLFSDLCAQVEIINAEPNGRNINDDCGSTNPAKLKAVVQSSQADLGLAFDGDADRLIAVASDGAIIDGDRQLCLFANDMAQRDLLLERKVVITEMSNLGLRQALELADISTIEVPVGDRNILAQLEEGAATLGGEQSGHIVFWDYATTGDGLLSGALLADLVVRSGQPSSDLARDAMLQLPQVLVNVPVTVKSSDFPLKVQQEIQAAQDRLTDNGRVLVRASGTEALIRVMVEAPDERVARSEAQRLADVIQAAMR